MLDDIHQRKSSLRPFDSKKKVWAPSPCCFKRGQFSNKIDILSHKHSKALTGNAFEFPSCERGLLSRLTFFINTQQSHREKWWRELETAISSLTAHPINPNPVQPPGARWGEEHAAPIFLSGKTLPLFEFILLFTLTLNGCILLNSLSKLSLEMWEKLKSWSQVEGKLVHKQIPYRGIAIIRGNDEHQLILLVERCHVRVHYLF